MDFNSAGEIAFKAITIFVALFYLLYSLVIGKQVRIMGKTVDDKGNQFVYAVSSLQTAVGVVILIFSIFLI